MSAEEFDSNSHQTLPTKISDFIFPKFQSYHHYRLLQLYLHDQSAQLWLNRYFHIHNTIVQTLIYPDAFNGSIFCLVNKLIHSFCIFRVKFNFKMTRSFSFHI